MIFLLIFILLALFLANLWANKWDFFAPPCMVSAVYLACVVLSLYNYRIWELNTLSYKTVLLVSFGVLVFSAVGVLLEKMLAKKHSEEIVLERDLQEPDSSKSPIQIHQAVFWCAVAFQLLTVFLCVFYILRFGRESGVTGWSNILHEFRFREFEGTAKLPEYVDQMNKLVTVFGYVYLYVFVHNLVAGCKRGWRLWILLLPVCLHLVRSFAVGNRYNMLAAVAGAVYLAYILYETRHRWEKRLKIRHIALLGVGVVAVLAIFVMLKSAVGRTDSISPVYYIVMYASGWVKALDMYLCGMTEVVDIGVFGQETFSGLNIFLANRGWMPMYSIDLEFCFVGENNVGNVYGALRRYTQDFGPVVAMLFMGGVSAFFSGLYALFKHDRRLDKEMALILFSYMVNAMFILPMDDKFYTIFVTPGFVIYLVLFYVAYRVIIVRPERKGRFFGVQIFKNN